jgi:hypothetical protein
MRRQGERPELIRWRLYGTSKTWSLNNFWMAHKPKTMSELYSHLHEELDLRLAESERVGYGFVLPGATATTVAPNAPKLKSVDDVRIAA